MPLRVLVTTALAAPLAQHLAGQGLHPVHVPLIEAVPTGEAAPDGAPAGVLVTSARTPRMAPDLAALWPGPPPRVAVLGPSTQEDAEAAGLAVHAVAHSRQLEGLAEAAARAGRSLSAPSRG